MASQQKVIEILRATAEKVVENQHFLTELDNVIGDGDHGINLARGFSEVEKKLPSMKDKDIGAILKATGMTLVSTVGGASGPLYGTALMQAGKAMAGKSEITMADFITVMQAAIEGVMLRGKSTEGEKTMLDAMIPAKEAMAREYAASGDAGAALAAGVKAARGGVEYTKTIIATKGRASYLGERSLGHQDPGATSFTIMLETVAERAAG